MKEFYKGRDINEKHLKSSFNKLGLNNIQFEKNLEKLRTTSGLEIK